MSEEEKEAIEQLRDMLKDYIEYKNSWKTDEDMEGIKKSIKALEVVLNYIDKLQKDNYKLDRENQHYFDRIQDLQKENEELKGHITKIKNYLK